jgi:hypothetical protein
VTHNRELVASTDRVVRLAAGRVEEADRELHFPNGAHASRPVYSETRPPL